MKVKILGAHKIETKDTRCACLLIDEILAIDAGALTSTLSFEEQQKIQALLLSHRHYDHVKDLPLLAMNFFLGEKILDVYAIQSVADEVFRYLSDGVLYPDFRQEGVKKPALKLNFLEIGHESDVQGYRILPVPVKHSVPGVGYQVVSPEGRRLFYTADTGPGMSDCWRQVSPELLIIEVSATNENHDFAVESGHLTPALLRTELESFREIRGYLPRVVTVHTDPLHEMEIETELAEVAAELNADIRLGFEGLKLEL